MCVRRVAGLLTRPRLVFVRIIGEDKTLSIKFVDDTVVLRGISADVDRAAREIEKIVEDAKNDEIVGSFVSRLVLWSRALLNVYFLRVVRIDHGIRDRSRVCRTHRRCARRWRE